MNLEIESNSKIVINHYNKKINIFGSILFLMNDIWNLSHDLNIYVCHHIYRKRNRITDYLIKKRLNGLDYSV